MILHYQSEEDLVTNVNKNMRSWCMSINDSSVNGL